MMECEPMNDCSELTSWIYNNKDEELDFCETDFLQGFELERENDWQPSISVNLGAEICGIKRSFGKPIVNFDKENCCTLATGTDTLSSSSSTGYFTMFNCTSSGLNPFKSVNLGDTCVRAYDWLDEASQKVLLVCGTGLGIVSSGTKTLNYEALNIHPSIINTQLLRDVKVNKSNGQVLSGGEDGVLQIWEPESQRLIQQHNLGIENNDTQIGSVKWNPHNPNLVSCTTDQGSFLLHDKRDSFMMRKNSNTHTSSSIEFKIGVPIYAHDYDACLVSDQKVLLGTNSNHLVLVDLRINRSLYSWSNPDVDIIGDLASCGDKVATFGIGGFSLFTNGMSNVKHVKKKKAGGSFLDNCRIVVADSLGNLEVYTIL